MNMMLKIGDFVDPLDTAQVITVPVPQRWFLLRVHPNKEFSVHRGLDRRNLAAYVPSYQVSVGIGRLRSDGWRVKRPMSKPVFPGVVFVPDFDAKLDELKITDGVINFLKFGDEPASMSPRLMAEVMRFEAFMNLPIGMRRRYQVGDKVTVNVGNSGLWTGRVDRLDPHGRLRVLVAAIQREIAVSVTEDQVEPA